MNAVTEIQHSCGIARKIRKVTVKGRGPVVPARRKAAAGTGTETT